MGTITTVTARKNFSEIINKAAYGKERIILTRRGKLLVAILPLEDLMLLEKLEDKIDIMAAEASLNEAKKKGTILLEELEKELDLEK